MTNEERAKQYVYNMSANELVTDIARMLDAATKQAAKQADMAADERWRKALEFADWEGWDGGVFHYEGRTYPWPKGFVPDCPATWARKRAEVLEQAAIRVEELIRRSDCVGLDYFAEEIRALKNTTPATTPATTTPIPQFSADPCGHRDDGNDYG